ncbi:unnamed protein product [Hermetia illucens]|uniref:Peptidase M14 domain-containing protein n=1 Tax=Hermetia illucens TaxID=343691 RepID=A0A7R8UHI4_HERIL|nr:carboxypeptidase B [Hermetia illucens]CAD7080708.1 unnamed protein product [Hermetia illucens]
MFVILIFLFTTISYGYSEQKDYSRYKKFYVNHANESIYRYMIDLAESHDNLDFWLLARNTSIILVPPELDNEMQQELENIGAVYKDTLLAVEENQICEERCEPYRSKRQSTGFFNNFHRYDAIVQYLQFLAAKYPDHAKFDSVAKTAGGRHLAVLRIAPYRRVGKKLVYIQGGSHAREWISISTVLYFVTELLENFNYYQNYLKGIEIGVVPVLNPDGYEYTHTRDRLWRKNLNFPPGGYCRGVDLNRNFGFKWGYIGASRNPCSEVYSGRLPFSEAETEWVRRYLVNNQYRTKLVIDVHSFGKYLFYPWGYQLGSAPTKATLHQIGQQVAKAIYKYRGTKYSVGTASQLLYKAAGGLDDYAYGALGVPLSYTFELPGSSFRNNPRDIIPIGKETTAGFIEFIKIVNGLS